MSLRAAIVPVTPFQQNCSVLWCDVTRRAAVVDPGGDLDQIEQVLAQQGLTLEKILLTHAHVDHAGAGRIADIENNAAGDDESLQTVVAGLRRRRAGAEAIKIYYSIFKYYHTAD